MSVVSPASFPVAARVGRFSYAIRNIVAEASRVEAAGVRVRYLNIGDTILFGFKTPPHLVEAVMKALRDGHQEYGPSPGLPAAREAVAAEYTAKGFPMTPDRVFVTAGTSEGIELALNAIVDIGDEVLVPLPTYPMYTSALGKIGVRAKHYTLDPDHDWMPALDTLESAVTPRTRVLVVIDPNNPTGACYPESVRRALIAFADTHNLIILADEVYNDLGYSGDLPVIGRFAPDAPIISLSSLSKAFLAPGWRTGWMAIGRTPRLDAVVGAVAKMVDARLCTTLPMQYAIAPALLGDRSHQIEFRRALKERADLTVSCLRAIPGVTCAAPTAAFYALPQFPLPPGRTDEHFVLSLLRKTGVLGVYGSGFGLPAEQGFMRIVFLAAPDELKAIYAQVAEFATDYLARGGH